MLKLLMLVGKRTQLLVLSNKETVRSLAHGFVTESVKLNRDWEEEGKRGNLKRNLNVNSKLVVPSFPPMRLSVRSILIVMTN